MRERSRRPRLPALLPWCVLLAGLLLPAPAAAQEPARVDVATVSVDGTALFRVRGIAARPAAQRAADIADRIVGLAADTAFRPESLRVEPGPEYTAIFAGTLVVVAVTELDAEMEGLSRALLAPAYADRIRRAIAEHRSARTSSRIASGAVRALAAVALAGVLLLVVLWLLRRWEAALQRALDRRIAALGSESRRILRAERGARLLGSALGLVRAAAVLLITLFLLEYALTQFPWTRAAGRQLMEVVGSPLTAIGRGLVAQIPNLIILVILVLVTRVALKLIQLYFDALRRGTIQLKNFEPELAQPVYGLVRVVIIAAALVIAYPFIPGSRTEAFKGLSLIAGLVFSLGSSAAVGNLIAGYMILFRRAFRVGDRVRIGDVLGEVVEVRLQVTHLRTIKGEDVTIPNGTVLGSQITNYSRAGSEGRLVLHTEVGIGYEVPWRQVEAMLIEAARRTPGLLAEPAPFVLQRSLGDFAVVYEINAYTNRTSGYPQVYADLHRNILDEFNEHGVQIMTPAYEGDTEQPKIVAKEKWFAAPARPSPSP